MARRMDGWESAHWSELDAAHFRSETYDTLGEADYKHPIREKGVTVGYEIRPWNPANTRSPT